MHIFLKGIIAAIPLLVIAMRGIKANVKKYKINKKARVFNTGF
jgi:hypothetical protein